MDFHGFSHHFPGPGLDGVVAQLVVHQVQWCRGRGDAQDVLAADAQGVHLARGE